MSEGDAASKRESLACRGGECLSVVQWIMVYLTHFRIRTPQKTAPPAATVHLFSSLLPHTHVPLWKQLLFPPAVYAFEIVLADQSIGFYITCPAKKDAFVQSQAVAAFPQSRIERVEDPLKSVLASRDRVVGEMVSSDASLPLKTYEHFEGVDALNPLLGYLSSQPKTIQMAVQIIIAPAAFPWQKAGQAHIQEKPHLKALVSEKIGAQGGKTAVRLIAAGNDGLTPLRHLIKGLASTFASFSSGEGNKLKFREPLFSQGRLLTRMRERSFFFFEHRGEIFNAEELATLWHPPNDLVEEVKNIEWGRTLRGEPPQNLPVVEDTAGAPPHTKIGVTLFKNKLTPFGIKAVDRRRHVYIVGKTGAGKSTLIANMAITDIRAGRGVGIIDPHGDLSDTILDYIPKSRLSDVVYLEPFDTERPFVLNLFEHTSHTERDLIASGVVAIFAKLYSQSWGPRLEYILRNTILTLLEHPGSTLADVLPLLSVASYRQKVVSSLSDPVLRSFWEDEFEAMPEKFRAEAISPIQNKVGQFIQSQTIRAIVGRTRSTVRLDEIINTGKILILNLSQGKLGEDNAALLGAMVITKLQLAAMGRAHIPEDKRRDFLLYVDEFQNFATDSFMKILSEARKYRLALTLTNQYIEQLGEGVQRALFGNVGTLISFGVGARDAQVLTHEFADLYAPSDLVTLNKHEIVLNLCVDGMSCLPFPARTVPLPPLKNGHREKMIRLSRERYGRPEKIVGVSPRRRRKHKTSQTTVKTVFRSKQRSGI
ncbi:MAG: type IV secretion system DNA-binding domain-containing protein [Anaerolineae bacterium]